MSKKEIQLSSDSYNDAKKDRATAALKTVFQDLNNVQRLVNASLFGSDIENRTQESLKMASFIASKADEGDLNLQATQLMTDSIQELSKIVLRAKAANPLFPNEIVDAVTKTTVDANISLKLTEEVFK